MSWRIPFDRNELLALSERYKAQESYQKGVLNAEADRKLAAVLTAAKRREYMRLNDLEAVARWKYRGPALSQMVAKNCQEDVKEITRVAFATESERLRIGALASLHGVAAPTASVILHFVFPDRYPVLDQRAMRTINAPVHYQFDRWLRYGEFCRDARDDFGVTLRTLDQALWRHDYERKKGWTAS